MDENSKKVTEELAEKAEKAAKLAKDKISEIDSEQVKKAAQTVADKSKETFEIAKNMAENIDSEEINKNVKEISAKTKEELNKRSKKELAAGAAVIVLMLVVLSKIGWGNVFAGLFLVSLIFLIYNVVKKKPKKKSAIAVIVFFVLMGVVGNSGIGGKKELMELCGNTADDVMANCGNPESSSSSLSSITYGYGDGDFEVLYNANGYGCLGITLNNGNYTLMGISIGDTEKKIDKAMNEIGAVFEGEVKTNTGKIKTFSENNNSISILIENGKTTCVSGAFR